jgi:ABC-2 type transport system ATP-binding protein
MSLETGSGVAAGVHGAHRAAEREAQAVSGERLDVRAVTKRWAGTAVLDDLSLALEPATLVSLVGSNGTGKTTLLRIVAGLIAPDAGTVSVEGLDPARDRREYQRRIGFLSAAQTGLYARFTVANHLEYWARVSFVPRGRRAEAVERALGRFDLAPIARQRADRLSMGQRQRVRLAMTFLHDPALVLLDEPRNSLDDEARGALLRVLDDFVSAGGTAVWCAPSADEVDAPATRSFTLVGGRLAPS